MDLIELLILVAIYGFILRMSFRYGYFCSAFDSFIQLGYNKKSAMILSLNWLSKREIMSVEDVDPPEELKNDEDQ